MKINQSSVLFILEVNVAKEFSKSFYRSKKWKSCRDSYIAKRIMIDGGLCERCHEEPGYILHHKVTLTEYNISDPDISLNHCRLEYLCKKCHDLEHYDDIHPRNGKRTAIFDAYGQMIPEGR